ncbi:hypothetical protein GCM10023115_24780 [Pontixanthobacter gangjinensis]|uniref:Uncharacterized protein n=1 Tax=Christiangramia aestuarii TaxID=1028746 RepID=A0A7K1LSU3_9FLAO|nr:hypothetical protein [Christiangramia aestuarii]MUP43889.1 hypothetical protein [Christiangramia aestuarii]
MEIDENINVDNADSNTSIKSLNLKQTDLGFSNNKSSVFSLADIDGLQESGIVLFEKGKYKTYTISVKLKRPDQKYFSNLVIEQKDEDFRGYVMKYFPENIQEHLAKNKDQEPNFNGRIEFSGFRYNLTELKELIEETADFNRTSKSSKSCESYIEVTYSYPCSGSTGNGKHWPGDICFAQGADRAGTETIRLSTNQCTGGGGNIGSDPGDTIGIDDGSGGSGGTFNPGDGNTIPSTPEGFGDTENSQLIAQLLEYQPQPYHSALAHKNYREQIGNFAISSNMFPVNWALRNHAELSNLNENELYQVSVRAKTIMAIMAKNDFADFETYSSFDQRVVTENTFFIGVLPSLKELGVDLPNTTEEWKEFGEFTIAMLIEIFPEPIPGVGEALSIYNAISSFNAGDYTDASTELAYAVVGFLPVGKVFKNVARIAKGFKIVVKMTKALRKAKKVKNAISNNFDLALQNFNQIGIPGNEGVRVLSGTSAKHANSFFERLSKNFDEEFVINTENGDIYVRKMLDGSKIQYREWATQSDGVGNLATIEFLGGNYNRKIQKIKFNE